MYNIIKRYVENQNQNGLLHNHTLYSIFDNSILSNADEKDNK